MKIRDWTTTKVLKVLAKVEQLNTTAIEADDHCAGAGPDVWVGLEIKPKNCGEAIVAILNVVQEES